VNILKFIVCVKEVPESLDVKIDTKTNQIQKQGNSTIINPFDQFILEEALRLRKEGDEIIAISMGSPETKKMLMKCLALGADKAVLLNDEFFNNSDTYATAYTLSKAIKKLGDYDIIFCGLQSMDTNTGQVGPELAALLEIPQITYVESVENFDGKNIVVKAVSDEGYKMVESKIPLLLSGIPASSFQPSLPPLRSILAAQKKPFLMWNSDDLGGEKEKYGLAGSLIKIVKLYHPPPKEKGIIITDEPEIAIEKLIELLSKDKVI
jgi:electron transfer flavoprotein alpha/beta subunit